MFSYVDYEIPYIDNNTTLNHLDTRNIYQNNVSQSQVPHITTVFHLGSTNIQSSDVHNQ